MAFSSSKRCSMCPKGAGICFCTGCEKYFCKKDFDKHRDMLSDKLDGCIQERNALQDKMSKLSLDKKIHSPLLLQIDAWQQKSIEKINKVAEQARQEVIQHLKSQQTQLKTKFDELSKQLMQLKESEDFVETDLKTLTETINRLERDFTQPNTIELNTEQTNNVPWDTLIYVVDKTKSLGKLISC